MLCLKGHHIQEEKGPSPPRAPSWRTAPPARSAGLDTVCSHGMLCCVLIPAANLDSAQTSLRTLRKEPRPRPPAPGSRLPVARFARCCGRCFRRPTPPRELGAEGGHV